MEKKDVFTETLVVLAAEVYRDIVHLARVKLGIETANLSDITGKNRIDLRRLGYKLLLLASNMKEEEYDLTFDQSSIKLYWMNDEKTATLFSMNIVDERSLKRLKFRDFADEASIHADLRVFRHDSSIVTDLTIGFETVKKKHDILLLNDC